MKEKLLKNIFLILAVIICTQTSVWAYNGVAAKPPVAQERCHLTVEPGFDGDGSHAGTATGNHNARAQLRNHARGNV